MRKTPLRPVMPMPPRTAPIPARRTRHAATGRPVERTTAAEWADLREALWARCGGHCEACDGRLSDLPAWESNHRQLDGQGGPTVLSNLVAIHPRCHTLSRWSIHANPAWATLVRGLVVPSWADPARVPLVLPDGQRVLLSDDGRYRLAPPLRAGYCPALIHGGGPVPTMVSGMFVDLYRERVTTDTAYCLYCAEQLAVGGWFVPIGGDAA